jgi:hypothetical protein
MSVFDPFSDEERRDEKNRLKRIAVESQQQEEGQIRRWLELAKQLFDRDDDPNAQTT